MALGPEQWAADHVRPMPDPDALGPPLVVARQSYYLWLIQQRLPHGSTVRDAGKRWLKAQGWRTKRVDRVTYWRGLWIIVPGEPMPNFEALDATESQCLAAIKALRMAGMISRTAAREAWEDMTA